MLKLQKILLQIINHKCQNWDEYLLGSDSHNRGNSLIECFEQFIYISDWCACVFFRLLSGIPLMKWLLINRRVAERERAI